MSVLSIAVVSGLLTAVAVLFYRHGVSLEAIGANMIEFDGTARRAKGGTQWTCSLDLSEELTDDSEWVDCSD